MSGDISFFIFMIKTLQAFRGVFAIFIFLHHFPYKGGSLFGAGGDAGVAFFLMASGFFMYMHHRRDAVDHYGKFMRRRATKLYPLHWVCLALYFMLVPAAHIWQHIPTTIVNALLLQSYIPIEYVYFSCNSVSWFLCDILLCYAVFPVLVRLVSFPLRRLLPILASVLSLYVCVCLIVPAGMENTLIYVCPFMRWIDFLIGMLICRFWLCRRSESAVLWLQITAVAAGIVAVFVWPYITPRISLVSLWWVPWSLLIWSFAVHDGIMARVLSASVLQWLGKISFQFYMIHYIVIQVVRPWIGTAEWSVALWACVAFCVSLVSAYLLSRILGK